MTTIRDEWISPCGEHRLILGDCLEVLPKLRYILGMDTTMATPAKQIVGANVRRFRRVRGMSQVSLAEAADMPQSFISRIEKGAFDVRTDTLDQLAAALRINTAMLLVPLDEPVAEKISE